MSDNAKLVADLRAINTERSAGLDIGDLCERAADAIERFENSKVLTGIYVGALDRYSSTAFLRGRDEAIDITDTCAIPENEAVSADYRAGFAAAKQAIRTALLEMGEPDS